MGAGSGASDTTGMMSDDPAVELSARRTGMSFQRTRLADDRTLMSVIRTSLSLISFGFTIFQFFGHLTESKVLTGSGHPARNFGATLVLLGLVMLVLGIGYHLAFMKELRRTRRKMVEEGLIHGESHFPPSLTLVVAVLLLLVGTLAAVSMTLHAGPFQ